MPFYFTQKGPLDKMDAKRHRDTDLYISFCVQTVPVLFSYMKFFHPFLPHGIELKEFCLHLVYQVPPLKARLNLTACYNNYPLLRRGRTCILDLTYFERGYT